MANALLSIEELTRFRTKLCKRSLKDGCDFGPQRCQYSHNVYWPRRCPFYLSDPSALRYIPDICPDITILDQSSGKIISMCNRGGYCPFAHSIEEVIYHPLCYKTEVCTAFQKGECKVYYCHLIHGLAERRPERKYTLPFTKGINLAKYPNVTVVEKTSSSELSNVNNAKSPRNQLKTKDFEKNTSYGIDLHNNTNRKLSSTNIVTRGNSLISSFFDLKLKPGLFLNSNKVDYNWNDSFSLTYNSYLFDSDPCSEIRNLVFKWRKIIENPEQHLGIFNFDEECWEIVLSGLLEVVDIINTLKTLYCKEYCASKAFNGETMNKQTKDIKSNCSHSMLSAKRNHTLLSIGEDQEIKCTVSTENSSDLLLQPQLRF